MSGTGRTTIVVCGALATEVRDVVRRRGWDVDVRGISSALHLRPDRIAAPLEACLAEVEAGGGRSVVVYGDCGSAGAIDRAVRAHRASRIAAPDCYALFGGPEVRTFLEERPGTFLLTDWLVRNFHRAVVRPLGLDRYPDLKDDYFRHYTDVLYLRQADDAGLDAEAERIAGYLGCRLTVRVTGLRPLEEALAALVAADADGNPTEAAPAAGTAP